MNLIPIGETAPAPMTRPYTAGERLHVIGEPLDPDPTRRMVGKIATTMVDVARYSQAAIQNPDHSAHFSRLIAATEASVEGWFDYMANMVVTTGTERPVRWDVESKAVEAVQQAASYDAQQASAA